MSHILRPALLTIISLGKDGERYPVTIQKQRIMSIHSVLDETAPNDLEAVQIQVLGEDHVEVWQGHRSKIQPSPRRLHW